jgi:hypothetical protein
VDGGFDDVLDVLSGRCSCSTRVDQLLLAELLQITSIHANMDSEFLKLGKRHGNARFAPSERMAVGNYYFPTAKSSMRTQIMIGRSQIMRHFENRVDPQTVGVDAVFMAGGDHHQAEADDIGQAERAYGRHHTSSRAAAPSRASASL